MIAYIVARVMTQMPERSLVTVTSSKEEYNEAQWPKKGSAEVVSPTGNALRLLLCAEHSRVSVILTLHLGHLETNMNSKRKTRNRKTKLSKWEVQGNVWVNISGLVMTRQIYKMSIQEILNLQFTQIFHEAYVSNHICNLTQTQKFYINVFACHLKLINHFINFSPSL